MRLLVCLAEHAGEVVSIDDLLSEVWPGVTVTPDSVYQAVTSLRRLLGDDPKRPTYIATVPRLGYRMVSTVSRWANESAAQTNLSSASDGTAPPGTTSNGSASSRFSTSFTWALAAVLVLSIAFLSVFLWSRKMLNNNHAVASAVAPQPPKSVAVLPFLDLTSQDMNEEYFADGMTEELIDRLSKVPGLRVPAPTSSFYYKGKKVSIRDIARTLGVTYVLDGSVRKSGPRLRVAARLICADNGYVVWSESYDRPFNDTLKVQDDIAREVTKALRESIDGKPEQDATP